MIETNRSARADQRSLPETLRILIHKSDGCYVAQCLEHDVAVQADSIKDLEYRFFEALIALVVDDIENGRIPLENEPPAPERFWQMYSEARPVKTHLDRFVSPAGTPARHYDARVA